MPNASPFTPIAPSDNLSSISYDKGKTLSAYKQIDSGEISEPYTITPTKYNGKHNTSDVWLVKFNRELTAEEKAVFDTFVRGPLTESRKISKTCTQETRVLIDYRSGSES